MLGAQKNRLIETVILSTSAKLLYETVVHENHSRHQTLSISTTSNRRTILHFTYGKFEIENGHIHARPNVLAYHESAFNDSKLNIYTYMKT